MNREALNSNKKIRVILFAKTGFGNNALKVLANHELVELIALFTSEKENNPFPYYECEKIVDQAVRNNVTTHQKMNLKDDATSQLVESLSPDLIMVASYDQVVPGKIIKIPRLGIVNMHPSLLPKYRGATPTVWALLNDEKETGVTTHFIEDERIDSGPIILQKVITIDEKETDGTLRLKLALLSERVIHETVNLILSGSKDYVTTQNEIHASYYPKRTIKDGEITADMTIAEITRKIRAMSPFPGAYLHIEGKSVVITKAVLVQDWQEFTTDSSSVIIKTREGIVQFTKGS